MPPGPTPKLAPFFALPTWRKVVIYSAILIFALTGFATTIKELDVYGDPARAEPQTGHVFAMHVMHGSLRFATSEERQSLLFWQAGITEWAAPGFVLALFVWVTYRDPLRTSPKVAVNVLNSEKRSKHTDKTTA